MNIQSQPLNDEDLLFLSFDVDDENYTDPRDCEALFRRVILECLIDALWPWPSDTRTEYLSARAWFRKSRFVEVCQLAGLNPTDVYREFERRVELCDSGEFEKALDGLFWNPKGLTANTKPMTASKGFDCE